MLKEERELRMWIKGGADERSYKRNLSRLITAFRRAVIEECAKVANEWHNDEPRWVCCHKAIAAAIRKEGKG